MNNLPFGNHNHRLMESEDLLTYPGLKSGTKIQKVGEKSRSKDPDTLCASKHNVIVGVTTTDTGEIIPFESSIVVLFTAADTSGAGLIGEAYTTLIFDPLEYERVVKEGKDIMQEKYDKGEASALEYYGYNTAYYGSMPVRWVTTAPSNAKKIWNSIFGAESFNADVWGTDYHYEDATAHKISIKITNKFEGVLRTVYDSELAGSSTTFEEGGKTFIQPAVSYFAVDSPGLWTVTIDSIGSGSCSNPKLAQRETFTVATPENWGKDFSDPTVSVSNETEEPETFVETISGGSTTKTNVGLETIIGGMVIGGALIYALLG